MKTLFIHPTDPSTDFCKIIYEDYRDQDDVTILTGTRIPSTIIKKALVENDRIVFIGHGTEYGLLDKIGFRYVITAADLQFFRNKPVVCMWCNANIFAEKHNLNAFATGMFVSEKSEAEWYRLSTDQKLIDESNELFCRILSRCVFDDPKDIRTTIERGYKSSTNPIVKFNRECMGFED